MIRSRAVVTAPILFLAAAGLDASPPTKRLDPTGEETRFLSQIEQITFSDMGLFNAGEAYFSPDAKTIIFQATPVGKKDYQIYTLELASRRLKMVSTGKGACTCAFFRPDGKKILFASTHLDPDVDKPRETPDAAASYKWMFHEHMDVFEADPDGSNLKRLTDAPGYDAEASYSPDGKRIVLTSQRDNDLEIYVMDADGKNPRRITNAKGYDGGPFFSPDGKQIIYRGDHRNDDEMNLQLHIVGADGSNDRALTDNPIFNWCPYWHPSGTYFIFTQADHRGRPNYDLFLMKPDGSGLTRVTFDPAFDGLPVLGPDGKKLMWTSKRGDLDEPQVFIADFKAPDDWK